MKKFDHSLLKDPRYFSDGRMDAHSDHTYYRCEEEREDGKTSFRHSLNGLWKFHYARNYASRWKDMMHRSMPMSSIRGKAMKNFIRDRSRNVLTRWQAM